LLNAVRAWLILRGTGPLRVLVGAIPPRFMFVVVVAHYAMELPFRGLMKAVFMPAATKYALSNRRLSSFFSRQMPASAVRVLCGLALYSEAVQEIDRLNEVAHGKGDPRLAMPHADALFNLGNFAMARSVLKSWQTQANLFDEPEFAQLLGQLDLIVGDEDEAVVNLSIAALIMRHRFCPHQNLAARYGMDYRPHSLDLAGGKDARLFDGYNLTGQRVTHVGEGQLCARLYAGALAAQNRLRAQPVKISEKLSRYLQSIDCALEDLRIVPVEWYTQIGHQGMLDISLRMREMGWWHGKVIFLMPYSPHLVANPAFQRLFDRYGYVLIPGVNIDTDIAAELFSLQRWFGMAFNAFELPDGQVVPWQDAGAHLMVDWEREGRGCPLREEFDRVYGDSATRISFSKFRDKWGMKADDWYVCLHMRDAAHYREFAGSGQTHRNADVAEYLEAIRYIGSRGGWVIKLGGPRSPKLPHMPNVIDYARSSEKTHLMDIQLIRYARFFIGTTSGLTNVAISLGVPCALVNCITTDAQLWGDRVRFALKRVRLGDGKYLTQQQITSTPWRWRMFDASVLSWHGANAINNSSDEILEVVKEVEALAVERPEVSTPPSKSELISRWRSCLSMPHYYGSALPSLYYLKKQPSFLETHQPLPKAGAPIVHDTAEPRRLSLS
jgi:putative glycosyltransferase (TIGR04372 family)